MCQSPDLAIGWVPDGTDALPSTAAGNATWTCVWTAVFVCYVKDIRLLSRRSILPFYPEGYLIYRGEVLFGLIVLTVHLGLVTAVHTSTLPDLAAE